MLVLSRSPVRAVSREVTSASLFNSSDSLTKKVLSALSTLVTSRRCLRSTKSSSSSMLKGWVRTGIWVEETMMRMPNQDMVLLKRKSGTRLASTQTCQNSIELLTVSACKLRNQRARWALCLAHSCSHTSKRV